MKVKVISLLYIFQVLYVLCFTRPRYQVSVYRTIGPLVFSLVSVAEWPPFGDLAAHSVDHVLFVDYLYFLLFLVLVLRTGFGF